MEIGINKGDTDLRYSKGSAATSASGFATLESLGHRWVTACLPLVESVLAQFKNIKRLFKTSHMRLPFEKQTARRTLQFNQGWK